MIDLTDFEIGQGETFKIMIQLQNRSDSNVPLDISDYSFSGQVRENYTTDEIAATFTFEKINPPTSGSLFVQLTASETSVLTQRRYVYDIQFTDGAAVRRILEGGFTVRPAVTR
jgi:hypothetical protein